MSRFDVTCSITLMWPSPGLKVSSHLRLTTVVRPTSHICDKRSRLFTLRAIGESLQASRFSEGFQEPLSIRFFSLQPEFAFRCFFLLLLLFLWSQSYTCVVFVIPERLAIVAWVLPYSKTENNFSLFELWNKESNWQRIGKQRASIKTWSPYRIP